jgi:hypothetical protein
MLTGKFVKIEPAMMSVSGKRGSSFRVANSTCHPPAGVLEVLPGDAWAPDLLRCRYVDSAPIRVRRHLQESLTPFDQHGARRIARVLLQDSERALEISDCIR